MNTQLQVSKSDYKVLVSVYQMLKGGKCEITRQSIILKSGISKQLLYSKVNNVYIKEKILEETK